MIEVSELRIGNWVFDNSNYVDKRNKKPIVVETIWHNGIDVDTFYDGLIANTSEKDLEPILLTPEILEKCKQFKYVNGRGKTGCYIIDTLRINVEENFSIASIKTPNGRFMELVRFDYVHQLQNLYFALTGTELNIEL